jgi:hypothetical protein
MREEVNAPDGWTPLVGAGWLEALHCRYSEDQVVVVSLHRNDSGYEVREKADSGTPGANEAVVGARESLAAARELMIKTCRDWDSWVVRRSTLGCN